MLGLCAGKISALPVGWRSAALLPGVQGFSPRKTRGTPHCPEPWPARNPSTLHVFVHDPHAQTARAKRWGGGGARACSVSTPGTCQASAAARARPRPQTPRAAMAAGTRCPQRPGRCGRRSASAPSTRRCSARPGSTAARPGRGRAGAGARRRATWARPRARAWGWPPRRRGRP